MTYREGGNIDHRRPTAVYLDDEATWAAVLARVEPVAGTLARLENQITNQLAQDRPTLAQREASGCRLNGTP